MIQRVRAWVQYRLALRQWRKLPAIQQVLLALQESPELRKAFRKVLRVKGFGE